MSSVNPSPSLPKMNWGDYESDDDDEGNTISIPVTPPKIILPTIWIILKDEFDWKGCLRFGTVMKDPSSEKLNQFVMENRLEWYHAFDPIRKVVMYRQRLTLKSIKEIPAPQEYLVRVWTEMGKCDSSIRIEFKDYFKDAIVEKKPKPIKEKKILIRPTFADLALDNDDDDDDNDQDEKKFCRKNNKEDGSNWYSIYKEYEKSYENSKKKKDMVDPKLICAAAKQCFFNNILTQEDFGVFYQEQMELLKKLNKKPKENKSKILKLTNLNTGLKIISNNLSKK